MGDKMIASFTVLKALPELSEKMRDTLKESQYFVPQFESHLKLPTSLCIEVKNDSVPNSSKGITFGSNENCGVMLPEHESISHVHFALTFDHKDRLVIMDHSTNGTEVKYGEQGAGLRVRRQWILNDPRLPYKFRRIEISVAGVLSFQVDVRLMSSEPLYRDVAERFRFLCKENENTGYDLQELRMTETRDMLELTAGDIWLHWQVAKGASGSITRCWNTRDGSEKATKTPLRESDEARLPQEARFLERLKDHHHVVRFLGYTNRSEVSPAQIEMEYLSGGSLEKPEDASLVSESAISEERSSYSKEEASSILAQCLSVLVKMHNQCPSICHRDIKPSNILINQRTPSGICVKLADFGEAKEECEEETWGGNAVYAAPEFVDGKCEGNLDIWSLGLTTLRLFKKEIQELYCARETEFWAQMKQSEDSLVQFLRDCMIQKNPSQRLTAAQCLERLYELQGDDGIKPCGCSKPKRCADNVSECEDEGVRTPTMSNVQEESSNSSTPTQKNLADGQSHETNSSSAEGSTEGSTTPTQTPASPAHISTVGEASESTDETRALLKGKRRAEACDELSDQKRPKI